MSIDVAIVGAGLAGLATAGALQRIGYKVALFNKTEEGPGVAITLWPNAVSALHEIGFDPPWEHIGHPIHHMQMSRSNGEAMFSTTPGWIEQRCGTTGFTVPREALLEHLTAFADGVRWEGELMGATPGQVIDCRVGPGHVKANYLIGADGIRSLTRKLVCPDYQLTRHRMVVVRGISNQPVPHRVGDVAFGRGVQGGLFTMRTGAYWFVAIDEQRVVGLEPAEIAHHVGNQLHSDLRYAVNSTSPDDLVITGVEDGPLALGQDNISFVGDAAHPMAPTMGQGAGMGFEDAAVLKAIAERFGLTQQSLRHFEQVRRARVRSVSASSRAAATQGVSVNPVAGFLRDAFMTVLPNRLVQSQLAKTFTFSATEAMEAAGERRAA